MTVEEPPPPPMSVADLQKVLLAYIGRSALAIISTVAFFAFGAASQWFPLVSRVGTLESWRGERDVAIQKYYEDQRALAAAIARIESRQMANLEAINEIKADVRRLSKSEAGGTVMR